VTEFNKIFSDRQQEQGVEVLQRFRDWLCPCNVGEYSHLDVADCLRRLHWIEFICILWIQNRFIPWI